MGVVVAAFIIGLLTGFFSFIPYIGMASGASVGMLWSHAEPFQSGLAVLYALVVLALWHAPIYGWLLLVSGWSLEPPKRRRLAVVSSDRRCGIHDYSEALCDGLRANGHGPSGARGS